MNTVGDFSVFILLTLVFLRESLKNRHRSCAPLPREGSCFVEMSRHYSTCKIYYKARNLIASRTTAHHHKLFAKSCIENNVIPNGLYFKFYPTARSDFNDELREFGRQRLTETSKDLLNFLYHKYSIAQENAHKKFKDYKNYVTKNFPSPIGRQIFSHVYNFNSKRKKGLYKRRKKKIYFLIRNYRCNASKNVRSQGPYNSRFKKIIHAPNLGNSINKINNTVHNSTNISLHSSSSRSQTAGHNISRLNSGTSVFNLARDLNVDTSFSDYISECNLSPSICKTINKVDGYIPVSNLTPSAQDEPVCPIVQWSGTISSGPNQAPRLFASTSLSADLVATGGTMQSSNGGTENYDRYSNLSASHVGTTSSDYISKSNSSPCVCKAINMIEGFLPAPNQAPGIHVEQSRNIVLSSHRTDADNSVRPVANFGGTIPYSSPQKVIFKDHLSIDTCHVVSGNTQQDLTKSTYCFYDDTNVSGINLTSSVIPDNSSNMSLADKNFDKPSSSPGTSDNPIDTARPKNVKACRRFRKLFRKRIHRNKGHLKSVSNHAPMDFSNADLTPATISLLSKGPSFVPTPKHIEWGKLSKDFLKFKNKMRWRAKYGNQEVDTYENDSDEEIFRCFQTTLR